MASGKFPSIDKVAGVVLEALSRGATVEIDGLGSFRKTGKSYRFEPRDLPRVFVAYVHEQDRSRRAHPRRATRGQFRSLDGRAQAAFQTELGARYPERAGDFGLGGVLLFLQFGPEAQWIPGRDPLCAGMHAAAAARRSLSHAGSSGRMPGASRCRARNAVCGSVSRIGRREFAASSKGVRQQALHLRRKVI